jgi:hypothetical protein
MEAFACPISILAFTRSSRTRTNWAGLASMTSRSERTCRILACDDSPSEAKYAGRSHSADRAPFPTRSRQPALLGFQCDCHYIYRVICGHLNFASFGRGLGQLRFAVVGRCSLAQPRNCQGRRTRLSTLSRKPRPRVGLYHGERGHLTLFPEFAKRVWLRCVLGWKCEALNLAWDNR